MTVFEYKAFNPQGKTITGIIDADSPYAARQKLRATRVFPVSITPFSEDTKRSEGRGSGFLGRFGKVKSGELALVMRQLSALVGAGFPLVSALDAMILQIKSNTLQKTIARVKDAITEGNSLAVALSQHPDTFSPLIVNMVRAGETSGTLEIVLERLSDIIEKQQALKQKIRAAMAYPILMGFIGVAVLFFLLAIVVPTITAVFSEMNRVLPAPTRFLIAISEFLKSYWWVLILAVFGFIEAVRRIYKTRRGRKYIDKQLLRIPGIGHLSRKLSAARFTRTLGSLLENGVSLLTALDIVKNIVGNVVIRETIEEASNAVGKGQGLGIGLSAQNIFPGLCIQMIQVGEQTGELETMLYKVADVYEREVESTILNLTSIMEPLMILAMGGIVGFIVVSICLPIFEMNQLIK
jgi:general secretion pathway protein F